MKIPSVFYVQLVFNKKFNNKVKTHFFNLRIIQLGQLSYYIPLRVATLVVARILLRQVVVGRDRLAVDLAEAGGGGGLEVVATRVQVGEGAVVVIGTLAAGLLRGGERGARLIQVDGVLVALAA